MSFQEKNVSVTAFEGGFVVALENRKFVTTSLQKAMKAIRDHLAGNSSEESAE